MSPAKLIYPGIVAVTGANGFIGKAVCEYLLRHGFKVRPLAREKLEPSFYVSPELGEHANWSEVLADVSCIIHCAGRAHVMREIELDPMEVYREINAKGTKTLAEQAVRCGVKKFIFLSSIKVNGEKTSNEEKFKFNDYPNPKDPYGISKWEAEQALMKISATSELEVTIIRLPLVYGRGVRGNFLRLIGLINKGWPLPLASVKNKRSMIAMGNLLDILRVCIIKQDPGINTFLVSDNYDLSTPELVSKLAKVLGKPVFLFSFPVWAIRAISKFSGMSTEEERLTGSLQVDITHTCHKLSWIPPVSVDEGLENAFRVNCSLGSQLK